jgi:hypothetical protein
MALLFDFIKTLGFLFMTVEAKFTHKGKNQFHKKYEHNMCPLEAYAMLLTACLQIGWYANWCYVAYTSLKIIRAVTAACCMTPFFLLPILQASCLTRQINILIKPPKIVTCICGVPFPVSAGMVLHN